MCKYSWKALARYKVRVKQWHLKVQSTGANTLYFHSPIYRFTPKVRFCVTTTNTQMWQVQQYNQKTDKKRTKKSHNHVKGSLSVVNGCACGICITINYNMYILAGPLLRRYCHIPEDEISRWTTALTRDLSHTGALYIWHAPDRLTWHRKPGSHRKHTCHHQ